jgi:signal transduction histidine kinase
VNQVWWLRIAISFLLFAGAGTLEFVVVLNAAFQRQSHDEFVALAKANADFIRTLRISRTERVAEYLSQVLGMQASFHRPDQTDGRHEMITVPVEPGLDLTLIREQPTLRALMLRPLSLCALVVFWVLSFGLGWAVVGPYLKAQRLAFLGQMSSALAHEIQNPVAAIRLHGQLLERSEPRTARLIVDEAAKLEGLVSQWMFLARPAPPIRKEIHLSELLDQTVQLLGPVAEHARASIVVESSSSQRVLADSKRLGQVFHNIILNSIQAMPSGGILKITTEDRRVRFADTGPGFSPTALVRWSELHYSEKEGGMGIGLNVAKQIVVAHGGRMSVANRPEGGAVVEVEL